VASEAELEAARCFVKSVLFEVPIASLSNSWQCCRWNEETYCSGLLDALSRCGLQRRIAQHRPSQHLGRMLDTVWDSSKINLKE
jgi:hypothetical protein